MLQPALSTGAPTQAEIYRTPTPPTCQGETDPTSMTVTTVPVPPPPAAELLIPRQVPMLAEESAQAPPDRLS